MPRDISDSTSRKKDKHSSRDNLLKDYSKDYSSVYDAADEFSSRKSLRKYSTDDRKSSKKGEASGQSSGRKRQFLDHDENCFASAYDDFEDSKTFVRNSIQQHSRNGLLLPGISGKHSLVDYDDESSDSDSSSDSFTPQYPTGKTARRKSAVQVVSASVKADLNDMRQQSQQSDITLSRHVRVSSTSSKNKKDLVSSDEKNDKKKRRHSIAESPEPDCKTVDIPTNSPKSRHSEDHRGSRRYSDKEHDLTSDQVNCRKPHSADKPDKTSAVKTSTKEKDTKRAKKRDSETEIVSTSSNVHAEKSKAHKKSKKREVSEEKRSDDGGMEQRSRTNVPKQSSTVAYKKEKSQKVADDSFSHSKSSENTDRLKKTSSHLDSINGTKRLTYNSSSVQEEDQVLKLNSDDHVHVHKKREKERHSSKKKSRAADDSDSDNDKEKKDRSALKHDSHSSSCKGDKVKDKRNKDKVHRSRNEREVSEEGQISSDSSNGGRLKESKHKHRSNGTLRNGSSISGPSSQNASASSRKVVPSELDQPER